VNYDDDGLGAEAQKALFGLAGGATVEPQKFGTVVLGRVGCPLIDTIQFSDTTSTYSYISDKLDVYPTITDKVVHIVTGLEETMHYSLYSSTGLLVEREQFRKEEIINFFGFLPGIYLLCIHNNVEEATYIIIKR
jgi:hypothetical protein